MSKKNEIKVDASRVKIAQDKIPALDFADRQYDEKNSQQLKTVLVLLSTPRSGSTMICDLLYKSGFCLAHEYFQPYEYMPILAQRWGCVKEGILDKEKYFRELACYRTLESGCLGINLHGSHLPIYSGFKMYIPSVKKIFVRIKRRDKVAQAVSYEIARQTDKWSSEFQSGVEPVYSFKNIKDRLDDIIKQEQLTDAFLDMINQEVFNVIYEDMIVDPAKVLNSIVSYEYAQKIIFEPTLKRQSSGINEKWIKQFNIEYFNICSKQFLGGRRKGVTGQLYSLLRRLFNCL